MATIRGSFDIASPLTIAGITFANGSKILDSSDGVVSLTNAAGTDFNRLCFGGTTSGFPALQRSGPGFVVRYADDSGWGTLTASAFKFRDHGQIASTGDGSFRLLDNAGTSFTSLQFGGTSSSFPALIRNGTSLEVKLADNTAYSNLNVATITTTGAIIGSSAAVTVTGSDQAGAAPISTDYVRINAGGTGGIRLPTATVGRRIVIIQPTNGATTTTIYPAVGENFYGLSTNTGVSVGSVVLMIACECYVSGSWVVTGLPYNNSSGNSYNINGSLSLVGNNLSAGMWILGNNGLIKSNGDGIFMVTNNANTDFNRLQFGGTSSAFPSIKRSSNSLQIRAADDSAYHSLACFGLTTNSVLQLSGASDSVAQLACYYGTRISDKANGTLLFTDSVGNYFNRIMLGGTTSSYPSLKRWNAGLEARVADDTAFASITGGILYADTSLLFGNQGGNNGGLAAPANGVLKLRNSADTDFGRLQFGGTTSSFPALKRSSATLQVRLADDSAYGQLTASSLVADSTLLFNATSSRGGLQANADGVLQLRDAAGTDFGRLQFGGTSSSYPALKRNSTTIEARLADDSGYADFTADKTTATAAQINNTLYRANPVATPLETTDATVTTLITYTTQTDTVSMVTARVVGVTDLGGQGAGYIINGTFRNVSGTVTQVGSTTVVSSHEDDTAWNCTMSISGANVLVRVTGAIATTIEWNGAIDVTTTYFGTPPSPPEI